MPVDVAFSTWTHDLSPHEVETRAEFDHHLATGSLAGLTLQGLPLDVDPPDLGSADVTDALFVGCQFADPGIAADLVRRGASIVPHFVEVPYPTARAELYTPDDLAAGFTGRGRDGVTGFEAMYDTVVYRHFLAHGGALPDVREALSQRLHDTCIDNALLDATATWVASRGPTSAVGIMGGHAMPRGGAAYRLAATLAHRLADAGRLIVTGGGPGVMEAANLGAYLHRRSATDLGDAIDLLAAAPDYRVHDAYTTAALAVRRAYPPPPPPPRAGGARGSGPDVVWHLSMGGLAIPTWLYGHEPANLFAGGIAKYFSNPIREDMILRLARGGVVFAPGHAGTVQEVFQAATKAFYRVDGPSGPLIFLDAIYWSEVLPVPTLLRQLLASSPHGDLSGLVHVTDDVSEAVRLLTEG